jgi:glycosyltransferase involved in cell wall biosynthesis
VLLVWDRGPGRADEAIRDLAQKHAFVRPIWLSRNFGQHAATLAGMTSSQGEWVVTLDEDGQMDPAFIGAMLDRAYTDRAQLVYASPTNPPPHGASRNLASRLAKWLFVKVLAGRDFESFNSYRLMHGEIARSVAAYTGQGVYLDVALSWVVATVATEPVVMRDEGRPASNYSFSRLLAHFGRLVVSSGTRPLMFVSFIGAAFVILGALLTIWILASLIFSSVPVTGWPSTMVAILVVGGATLLSLGIIAQYVGAATNMSLGKPLYVVVRDPEDTFGP